MGNWSIGKLPPKSVGRRWIIEYIVLGKLTHCGEKTVLDSYLITYTKKKNQMDGKPKYEGKYTDSPYKGIIIRISLCSGIWSKFLKPDPDNIKPQTDGYGYIKHKDFS